MMGEKIKPGTLVWHELTTPDPMGAGRFYGKLFGWESKSVEMDSSGSYNIFSQNGSEIAGVIEMDPERQKAMPPHWRIYVSVADVDATAREAVAMGGKIAQEPFDIPGVGRIAFIEDPAGAAISLIRLEDS